MSRDPIKEFLAKFSNAESCDIKTSDACDIVGKLDKNIDKMDLRLNQNKEEVLESLDKLNNQKDCFICEATDGISIDLWDKWKRNNLNSNLKKSSND